ncbi:MAG: class IV lanthionine synthetase LanL, partial [Dehalococcoidia bacterium]
MTVLDIPDAVKERTAGGFARLVTEACAASAAAADWRLRPSADGFQPWFWVFHAQARPPAQGWKLHVSATVASAADVLRATLPVLLSDSASFKLADSLAALSDLNEGNGGPSQVGKFITIYPNDDAQAVRLAIALDEATRGLAGPVIASDRQLQPGSRVSYRYGGFKQELMQTPIGEVLPA